jgi:chromate transporter
VPVITALFLGLKAAVLAIVLHVVHRVGSRPLKSRPMLVLAALAFIGIFFPATPFPLIVIAAGVIGFIGVAPASMSACPRPSPGQARRSAATRICGAHWHCWSRRWIGAAQ